MVQRYQPTLVWAARRYGLSAEDAADAAQLTWMRCIEHIDQVTQPEQLGSWLVTICRRESIRLGTKRLREVPADDLEDHPDVSRESPRDFAGDVVDRLETGRRVRLLRTAMTTLSTRERELIQVLLDPEPPSYRQISQQLDMPIGSIGPIRMRALNRLRAAISKAETAAACPAQA